MKIKWNTNLLVNVVVIAFVVLMIALFIPTSFTGSPTVSYITDEVNSDIIKPIDADIPDTISHRMYKIRKDSISKMREIKNGLAFGIGGNVAAFFGVSGMFGCDTCSLEWAYKHARDAAHIRYYMVLPGWKIRSATTDWGANTDDSVKFYVEHGQGYIRKAINTYTKMKDGSTYHTMHIKDIPVKFRYDDRTNYLLIPVSNKTESIVNILAICTSVILLTYLLYLLAAFLKFIVDVSKGMAFTPQNIKRLLLIALSLLIAPFVLLALNLLMRLIFNDYFTPDVVLNTVPWKDSWQGIATGIVFLLLYKAFRQGKKLKDEHDLTV